MRPACFRYWIEAELSPGTWDTELPIPAGCSSIDDARRRAEDLRALGDPWKGRALRVVDRDGQEVQLEPVAT